MKEHNSYDDDYDFGDDDDFFNDLDNDGLKGEKDTTGSLIVLVMVVIGVFSISLAIYDVSSRDDKGVTIITEQLDDIRKEEFTREDFIDKDQELKMDIFRLQNELDLYREQLNDMKDLLRGETAVKDVEQSKTNEERYGF